jgi:transposase
VAYREIWVVEVREILRLWMLGLGTRSVARTVGVDRKTARHCVDLAAELGLQRGDAVARLDDEFIGAVLVRMQPGRPARKGASWAACLEQRALIKKWVDEDLKITKIHQLLGRQSGPMVPYRTLHRFISQELGGLGAKATIRVDDGKPGSELQIDFGRMGYLADETRRRRLVWALILTAVYSRHQFVWLTFRQTAADIIEGCERAWDFFGGVFHVLIPDNTKAIVAKADAINPRFSETFLEYAQARGPALDPTRVRDPRGKARVERVVPYTRNSFFRGEVFVDLAHANERANHWCLHTAGMRTHGTTQQRPFEIFEAEERAHLLPVPPERYDTPLYVDVTVQRDQHICVGRALYSLPTVYVGEQVHVRVDRSLVRIYQRGQIIKIHPTQEPGQRRSDSEDFPEEKWLYATRDSATLVKRATQAGVLIGDYARRIADEPAPWRSMRSLFRLLGLVRRFGPSPVENACRRALELDVVDVTRIERMVTQGLEAKASASTARGPSQNVISLRFARPLQHFALGRHDEEKPS